MSFGPNGSVHALNASGVSSLPISDVLPRPLVEIDRDALGEWLANRTVLVTGAGGSIGTELSQQLAALRPRRLVMVDVSEYNLFQLETKFSARGDKNALRSRYADDAFSFCIGDVRDRPLMKSLFENFRPEVVLHAAAYKHVPLMERHPIEAFRNNTLATTTLLHLCQQYETELFVFVSTDKAVEPTSVLGATKRLAEWYVRSMATDVHCKIVRFGNVFGSQGSVVPLFVKQIATGGPVTVTHPEMERYFMSAHEACSLILQTLLLNRAPVYLFDMGEPVRITWLARQLIRRLRPDLDPETLIEYTGSRPGEKLHETLWAKDETSVSTAHDRIVGITGPTPSSREALEHRFEALKQLSQQRRADPLREALFAEDFRHIGQEA